MLTVAVEESLEAVTVSCAVIYFAHVKSLSALYSLIAIP